MKRGTEFPHHDRVLDPQYWDERAEKTEKAEQHRLRGTRSAAEEHDRIALQATESLQASMPWAPSRLAASNRSRSEARRGRFAAAAYCSEALVISSQIVVEVVPHPPSIALPDRLCGLLGAASLAQDLFLELWMLSAFHPQDKAASGLE